MDAEKELTLKDLREFIERVNRNRTELRDDLERRGLTLEDWPNDSGSDRLWWEQVGYLTDCPHETIRRLMGARGESWSPVEIYKRASAWLDKERIQKGTGTNQKSANRPTGLIRGRKKGTREETGNTTKLIAALVKHHRYADGSCLNEDWVGVRELTRLAGVKSTSTTSEFFDKWFNKGKKGGHRQYKIICRDTMALIVSLKSLNQEFAPWNLVSGLMADPREKYDDYRDRRDADEE
jgi:hypothetical protein